MSETPLTDALHHKLVRISVFPGWLANKDYIKMRKHAAELEAQLTAHTKIVAAARSHEKWWAHHPCPCPVCQAVRESLPAKQ